MKLGSLEVGERGMQKFGPFELLWKVELDHISWSLREVEEPNSSQNSWFSGALKYKGWNAISVESTKNPLELSGGQFVAGNPMFRIYVHEWPDFKKAMDFLYYELGREGATGAYESSFVKYEVENPSNS